MLRLTNRHTENHVAVISMFVFLYINFVLIPLMPVQNNNFQFMAPVFTPTYMLFYGKAVGTALFMSNLIPYVILFVKWIIKSCSCHCFNNKDLAKKQRYCCFCCRKAQTHLNPEFPFNRRYAQTLTLVGTTFSFGFAVPILFSFSFLILTIQYFLDKILITYYYKERVRHNDVLNRAALEIVKYGGVVFLIFGAASLGPNRCAVE